MITHGRITQVKAEKKSDEPITGMSVNVNIDNVAGTGKEVRIEYTYEVSYHAEIAAMTIKGELFADAQSDLGKKILDGWKKNHQLPPEVAEEIITALTYAGSSIGTLLAFAINVNAPINVPRAKVVSQTTQKPQAS